MPILESLHLNEWLHLFNPTHVGWKNVIQIMLVIGIVGFLYFRIQGTYIAQLLKGVIVILGLYILARISDFTIISRILEGIFQISIIGSIILFQPELRRLLVYLGQPELLGKQTFSTGLQAKKEDLVNEIVEAVRLMCKTKIGALIVLEGQLNSGDTYLEAGTPINALVSKELLLTLFHPNTPLHDGAVIVSPEGRVISAGVLLPLSENPKLSWEYGTRHRAAVGLSEISESRCLIVSEETGKLSWAYNGTLKKLDSIDDLRRELKDLYGIVGDVSDVTRKVPFSELFSSDRILQFFKGKKKKTRPSSSPPDERAKLSP